ncbi:hypothetical protein FVEG_06060 [Fusarium verticillioides 7600]|uniref:Uncharacterized protein n=1 Tax=Gibberella moniliformis (strain M3125 / FGSC 7600) TaxID=334819 RepID=W7MC12_GIBM7|nr:hypothetical protein FVEG_06060 [Fusarium verticillioides 7600]EWG45145.1 hypothetical protein FVEG_06060 [Fusarium verticillioides 7600]
MGLGTGRSQNRKILPVFLRHQVEHTHSSLILADGCGSAGSATLLAFTCLNKHTHLFDQVAGKSDRCSNVASADRPQTDGRYL